MSNTTAPGTSRPTQNGQPGAPARRSRLFAAAVAAAVLVPLVAILVTATIVAAGRAPEQVVLPGPTVTSTVTPQPDPAPAVTGTPAPVVTNIPIANPDDPLLDALTSNTDRTQACRFILGNINGDAWGASMEKFVSLFATARTLTAEPDLADALDTLVAFAKKNGYPDDALVGDAVSLCTDGAHD